MDDIDYTKSPTPYMRTKQTFATSFGQNSYNDSICIMGTLANFSIEPRIQVEGRKNSIESARTANYEPHSPDRLSFKMRTLKDPSTLTKANPMLFYDQESCSTEYDQVVNSPIMSPGHISANIDHFAYLECQYEDEEL